jgi:hypothetical protein
MHASHQPEAKSAPPGPGRLTVPFTPPNTRHGHRDGQGSDGASQLTDDLRLSRLSIVVTCFPRRFAGSLEWINKQLDGFVMQSGTFGAAC